MQRYYDKKAILHNSDGFAVVEATFVFPVMFMVFFVLMMFSFYLPQRAMLQRATQFAATAVAAEMSDTWIYYDSSSQSYDRYSDYKALTNGKGGVYVVLFKSVFSNNDSDPETIMRSIDEKENFHVISNGELTVECKIVNYVVYKEIVVTATRSILVIVDFSIIGFSKPVDLIVTSKAVVTNSDEFIRNVDLAVDFVYWASDQLGIDLKGIFEKIDEAGSKISGLFGI